MKTIALPPPPVAGKGTLAPNSFLASSFSVRRPNRTLTITNSTSSSPRNPSHEREFLEVLLKMGIKPRRRSTSSPITHVDGIPQPNSLSDCELLLDMLSQPINEFVIDRLCESGRTDEALRILHKMVREDGLEPSIDCYYSLINAYGKEMKLNEAMRLIVEVYRKRRIMPDVIANMKKLAARFIEIPLLSLLVGLIDVVYDTIKTTRKNLTSRYHLRLRTIGKRASDEVC